MYKKLKFSKNKRAMFSLYSLIILTLLTLSISLILSRVDRRQKIAKNERDQNQAYYAMESIIYQITNSEKNLNEISKSCKNISYDIENKSLFYQDIRFPQISLLEGTEYFDSQIRKSDGLSYDLVLRIRFRDIPLVANIKIKEEKNFSNKMEGPDLMEIKNRLVAVYSDGAYYYNFSGMDKDLLISPESRGIRIKYPLDDNEEKALEKEESEEKLGQDTLQEEENLLETEEIGQDKIEKKPETLYEEIKLLNPVFLRGGRSYSFQGKNFLNGIVFLNGRVNISDKTNISGLVILEGAEWEIEEGGSLKIEGLVLSDRDLPTFLDYRENLEATRKIVSDLGLENTFSIGDISIKNEEF